MKTSTLRSVVKSTLFLAVASVGLFTVSSCSKEDNFDFEGTVSTRVQLVNASPDAGAASLYLENVLRTPTAVAYGDASGYNLTYVGDQDAAIKTQSNGATVASSRVQLDVDKHYSFFLTGLNSNLSMLLVEDNMTAPAAGKAKVRFVNAANSIVSGNVSVAANSLYSGVAFKTATEYKEINAGTTTVALQLTSTNSATFNVTTNTNFESGKIYTIVVMGTAVTGGTPLNIKVIKQN